MIDSVLFHRSALVVLALALQSVPEAAAAKVTPKSGEQEQTIARCIKRASLGRSWLEKTLWGLRDQEGGWIGAEIQNTNGSHDLGPLQINSWWVPRIAALIDQPARSVRYWLRYDPCFGAEAARWIFLSALGASGDYWTAVGIYHSPTSWRQRRYTAAVAVHLVRRFGPGVFAQPRRN